MGRSRYYCLKRQTTRPQNTGGVDFLTLYYKTSHKCLPKDLTKNAFEVHVGHQRTWRSHRLRTIRWCTSSLLTAITMSNQRPKKIRSHFHVTRYMLSTSVSETCGKDLSNALLDGFPEPPYILFLGIVIEIVKDDNYLANKSHHVQEHLTQAHFIFSWSPRMSHGLPPHQAETCEHRDHVQATDGTDVEAHYVLSQIILWIQG